MKPSAFEYRDPASVDEALTLLREAGSDAKLLAGGQSLVPAMNFRIVAPSMLIDLNRLTEMQYVRKDEGGALQIGAMTRERQLEADSLIGDGAPLLAEAMPHIAHPQIRNRGTIGGSLSNADPAAELPVIMRALNARFKLRTISSERWVDAAEFFTGLFTTALSPDEILVEVEIPTFPQRTGWSFLEVAPRAGDYALMGVAALVTVNEAGSCEHARLVYLNAGEGPTEAPEAASSLEGSSLGAESMELAAETAATKEIDPFGNIHASADFQRHLARVLTGRALQQAADRAKTGRIQ